jgi:hypothetical protein
MKYIFLLLVSAMPLITWAQCNTVLLNNVTDYSCRSILFAATPILNQTCSNPNITYNYSFGDGTTTNNAQAFIAHTYLANGTYTVTVTANTANTACNCSNGSTLTVVINCIDCATIPQTIDITTPLSGIQKQDAQEILTANSTVNSNTGEKTRFTAGNFIELNPGFISQISGEGYFEAYINDCSNSSNLSGIAYRTQPVAQQTPIKYNIAPKDSPKTPQDITIFPNPVHDFFTIQYSTPIRSISIVDMLGRTLKIIPITDPTQTEIDTADLPQGVYLVWIDGRHSVKIIK